jgi:hypothetical protein
MPSFVVRGRIAAAWNPGDGASRSSGRRRKNSSREPMRIGSPRCSGASQGVSVPIAPSCRSHCRPSGGKPSAPAVKETQNELDKSYDSAKVDDGSSKTGEGTDGNPVLKDFKVSKCDVTTSEWGSKELALHIDYTNNGDRRYSYFLEGEVLADGKKISDFLSTAENLAPDQTFKDEDAGFLTSSDKLEGAKKLECKVIEANRHDY